MEVLPLYIKGNSIIPMGPDMNYVGEKPFNPITLDVWLCSEGECTIYDDDQIVQCRARRKKDRVVVDVSTSKKTYVVKLNRTGNSAMTVGGTGDVLAGIAGGLLAKGIAPFYSARIAAFTNGTAGDLAFGELGYSMMATDVIEKIPFVLKSFLR